MQNSFAQSNSVTIILGNETNYYGLKHLAKETDGLTSIVKVGDDSCRLLNFKPQGRADGFLYFSIDPGFKKAGARNVKIEIEYFDIILGGKPTTFGIHYDAFGTAQKPNPRYARAGKRVQLTGANRWMTATFEIRNATFQNHQNGGADFRIIATPPELYVRRVTVTRL